MKMFLHEILHEILQIFHDVFCLYTSTFNIFLCLLLPWSIGCSRCWIVLLGLCFLHRGTTASRHSWHSCSGWMYRSALSLSWVFWYTDAYVRPLRRALLRNFISHLLSRLVSVSALHRHHRLLPTHPSFNHRRSSFSGRCCPTVEQSAAERHVGVVNICFRETFQDPSLQSFFPPNLL